jgi:chitin disaccharide deacetylase
MTAYLVVNADDFGLTEGVNHAIADAHRDGIVTSASLLARGTAFDHAVQITKSNPNLGVGVHLTLTEMRLALADNPALETFLTDGRLPLSNQVFVRALCTGRLPLEAVEREFAAQIQSVLDAGVTPTHVDGHKYIHLMPGVAQCATRAARRFGIQVMRLPRLADPLTRWTRLPGMLILSAMRVLSGVNDFQSADRYVGFVDTGHLTESRIDQLLDRPVNGVTELVCHPAYSSPELPALRRQGFNWIDEYDFEQEAAAVRSAALRQRLQARGWQLANFREIFLR